MNSQTIRQTVKFAAIIVVTAVVGVASNVQSASASSYKNTDRINQIINKLNPSGWSYGGSHSRNHYTNSRYSYDYGYGHDHGYNHKPHNSGHYSYEYATPYAYDSNDYAAYNDAYTRTMDLSVYFERGSSRITWRTKKALNNLGYALSSPRLHQAIYRIGGHTDARGNAHANQYLSEQRARAVKKYLVHKFHINPRRLVTVGFGEYRLKNHYSPYSSVNRRVEVTLIANSYADLDH